MFKLKKNIAVSESGFLFDANTGDSYTLNKTGQIIIKLISEGKKPEEITREIVQDYDVEEHDLDHYMEDFRNMLSRYELIEFTK